jgi:hypothetical protein
MQLRTVNNTLPFCAAIFSLVLPRFSPRPFLTSLQVVQWDLVAHSCLPPLPAHRADITTAVYSPDSALLATCSQVRAGHWPLAVRGPESGLRCRH